MKREMLLGLSQFPATPSSLMDPSTGTAATAITVDLKSVCHHMFLDTYGQHPPNPNPLSGLTRTLITRKQNLEFVAGGLGSHKESRNAESMKWGKALCRWFLDSHCGLCFFAHMDDVLGQSVSSHQCPVQVARVKKGDTPDYLCADTRKQAFLAEAKGRQAVSISFRTKAFQNWRDQLQRVEVRDRYGVPLRTKGFIVASRLRSVRHANGIRARLLAEDPHSPGDREINSDQSAALALVAKAHHYAAVLEKLNLLYHADALRSGVKVRTDRTPEVGIWRGEDEAFREQEFVGGLYPANHLSPISPLDPYRFLPGPTDHWNPYLGLGAQTFFGLKRDIFERVVQASRSTADELIDLNLGEGIQVPEAFSYLSTGTLFAPSDAVRLVDVRRV